MGTQQMPRAKIMYRAPHASPCRRVREPAVEQSQLETLAGRVEPSRCGIRLRTSKLAVESSAHRSFTRTEWCGRASHDRGEAVSIAMARAVMAVCGAGHDRDRTLHGVRTGHDLGAVRIRGPRVLGGRQTLQVEVRYHRAGRPTGQTRPTSTRPRHPSTQPTAAGSPMNLQIRPLSRVGSS